ncbi:transcriptional regulator [Paucilactobacillus hokkaidonensis JCM 18461]|uniref:Transcriptional regulator n=2 Tax=Paucilactobacillus hokkaidonensis TaxID=1193095 RepID=A0A0A1H0C6_9LACO|nr:helix-turn-helix domain-containing protein [Paucilactobacillus hokkaidonensis]KRO10395.1 hypothetical protein IV59_GL001791 [Paucilactobacillus hokkaidonensis]BAP86713.1 transcriptional regulator [Paucilactobacillus hokkaidonensis JCM 18461]
MDVQQITTYNIGVEATMAVISGKWKPIILCHLNCQAMRNGELIRAIPNISQKMLTQQLRELESDDIITRHVYPQIPPKVEYCLTEYGKTLAKVTSAMCSWGERYIDKQRAAGNQIDLLDTNSEFYQKTS